MDSTGTGGAFSQPVMETGDVNPGFECRPQVVRRHIPTVRCHPGVAVVDHAGNVDYVDWFDIRWATDDGNSGTSQRKYRFYNGRTDTGVIPP